MSKQQYSLKNFFRLAPKALLDRYFHERWLLTDLDIKSLDENNLESIYQAWLQLSEPDRLKTEDDFRLIDSVADDQGIVAILEEARFHGEDLEPTFARMDGFYYKAFWTFLEHPGYVDIAARFCEADELPKTYWRDRDGLLELSPRDDEAACDELANVLKLYFRQKQGRGYACTVDVYRRGSKYYYFAYPEDFSRTIMEYQGEESRLLRSAHRPAFQVVFVFDPKTGVLSTFYEGKADMVTDLQELFARVILAVNLPSPVRDERTYELDAFKNPGFRFVYSPSSGIMTVYVKQLKLAIIGAGSQRITIEANPKSNQDAVYDLVDDIFNTGRPDSLVNSIPLSMVNVTRVGLRATFVPNGKRGQQTKTFYISLPNSCSLGHDGRDAVLRQMLIDSNIEPRLAAAASATR